MPTINSHGKATPTQIDQLPPLAIR